VVSYFYFNTRVFVHKTIRREYFLEKKFDRFSYLGDERVIEQKAVGSDEVMKSFRGYKHRALEHWTVERSF